MEKGSDAFRSIGEVAKLVGVAPHVLRYWETQFPLLNPMKRRDGRRYYRPDDVRLVAGLCEILREEGLTIRGARKMLARDRGEAVRARGAARLADALGAASPARPAPVPNAADETAAPKAVHRPAAEGGPPPRSRTRIRPAAAGEEGALLPLFAGLAPSAVGDPRAAWLRVLVETAARLRARSPAAVLTRKVHGPAQRLRAALMALGHG